jgi:hypothetical protein
MDDATRTTPGHLAALRTQPTTPRKLAAGTHTDHPFYGPRARLMAQGTRVSPTSITLTSIFSQWASADRIDGGGRDLIREIEGR